jgi:gas vesicle protein
MGDKSKIIGALILGAIAGAAIVKLLETEKGKELVESAKEKAKSTADDIKSKINQLENELAELLQMEKENQSNKA